MSAGDSYSNGGSISPTIWRGTLNFDASLSNSLYGASNTVQPPAIVLLPQIKFQGGDNIAILAAGLPKIVGTFGGVTKEGTFTASGAFSVTSQSNSGRASGSGGGIIWWDFDASRSSTIYGSSSTVQPPALVFIPQIKY